MAGGKRCEKCGANLQSVEGGRLRCTNCGTEFIHGTRWVPFLLTWALVGAVVGVGTYFVLAALGLTWGLAGWVGFGAITGVVATLLSRRFRGLRQI